MYYRAEFNSIEKLCLFFCPDSFLTIGYFEKRSAHFNIIKDVYVQCEVVFLPYAIMVFNWFKARPDAHSAILLSVLYSFTEAKVMCCLQFVLSY
jgi:hypothetical protein